MLRVALASLLALASTALAQDEAAWLRVDGIEGHPWGTDSVPLDGTPRPRDVVLPDSAFIGASKGDKPEDLELRGPAGERRFVRYAYGQLVDAWHLREGTLDPAPIVEGARPEWTGVVLGPAEDGFLAYGTASSWTLGNRTLLHWRDRLGKRELLASRAVPPPQYGVGRPAPLEAPADTGATAKLSGDFKKEARAVVGKLAGCFDQSRKPVGAAIGLVFDARGQPARVKVQADQPAFNLDDCVAGALLDVRAAPNAKGTLEMLRFQ
jgi:hypothetical protein